MKISSPSLASPAMLLGPGSAEAKGAATKLAASKETTAKGVRKPLDKETEKKLQEAEKVASEFETMFMDLIVKGMRQTAQPEESSNALDIYNGMLDGEYTKSMTGAQDFGVRGMLLEWMKTADPTLAGAGAELQKLKASQGAALEAYRAQAGVAKGVK